MLIHPSRRGLLTGLGALVAAPALVRASSLMPIRAQLEEPIGPPLYAFRLIGPDGLVRYWAAPAWDIPRELWVGTECVYWRG